jgi:hypothetical protein
MHDNCLARLKHRRVVVCILVFEANPANTDIEPARVSVRRLMLSIANAGAIVS